MLLDGRCSNCHFETELILTSIFIRGTVLCLDWSNLTDVGWRFHCVVIIDAEKFTFFINLKSTFEQEKKRKSLTKIFLKHNPLIFSFKTDHTFYIKNTFEVFIFKYPLWSFKNNCFSVESYFRYFNFRGFRETAKIKIPRKFKYLQ